MKTLPENMVPYKRTPEFNASTVPAGLLTEHNTKKGVWAKICVLEGSMTYRILEPDVEEIPLSAGEFGVVEPEIRHQVVPGSAVRFFVEFYRAESSTSP